MIEVVGVGVLVKHGGKGLIGGVLVGVAVIVGVSGIVDDAVCVLVGVRVKVTDGVLVGVS